MPRRPLVIAAVGLALGLAVGGSIATAATPNDTACRSVLSGTITSDQVVAYDACRFDKLDAGIAQLAPAPTATATPSPTTTAKPSLSPSPAVTTTRASSPSPSAPATTSTPPLTTSWPSAPPAKVCGSSVLAGPATAPAGAVTVPAGSNASVNFSSASTTYWFAPGVHTLGTGQYDQIVPGNSSTFVGAPGAVIDGQGKNQYAFTQHATNVKIRYLTIRNFVSPTDEGTVNHDAGESWTIDHNTITANGGAGVFVGSNGVLAWNCVTNNSQYGFQTYAPGGVHDVLLDHNEIAGNNTGDWETKQPGCGCTGGGKFWNTRGVRVTANYVHHNKSVALWADTNDRDFLFDGNWISDNDGQAIFYEISYNATIRNNVLLHNLVTAGAARISSGDNFPDAAIYLSESGGDARVPSVVAGAPLIDITGNLIQDNYNGVALWENADRFCNSPANTSSGTCTLANTSLVKTTTCVTGTIATAPYYSDCRWKTQNVKVHGNTFRMDRSKFGGCSPSLCGRNAIFSQYGSYPDWSPYKAFTVSQAVTFDQGNVFSGNRYEGGWSFLAYATDRSLSSAQWQAAPYGQDAGSTFTG